jgi:hypothetical protein
MRRAKNRVGHGSGGTGSGAAIALVPKLGSHIRSPAVPPQLAGQIFRRSAWETATKGGERV